MSAVRSLHELRLELDQLDQLRQRLSVSLLACAERLDSPGEPPAEELIDELASYRDRMRWLSNRLGGQVASRTDAADDAISFTYLQRLLDMRQRHEQAVAVLDQLWGLAHVEIPDFAPLALCLAEASRLRDLASRPVEAQPDTELDALYQQRHPLNSLLKLCDEEARLSDAEWTECNDRVTEVYGRQLATALARGRIQRVSVRQSLVLDEAPAPSHEAPPCEAPAAASEHQAEWTINDLDEDSLVAPSSYADSVFDVRTPPPKLRGIALPAVLAEESLSSATDNSSVGARRGQSALPSVSIPARSRSVSTAIHNAAARPAKLPELIARLLTEDRAPLAWHLSRCLDLRPGHSEPFPPTWLLSALALGRHLSYPKGEIARQLDDELRRFHPELLADADRDRQLAIGLLLRSAALPAALLAGSTLGATILRAFQIEPGFSQLYNYCSRIARYGDRLNGQIVEMFRPEHAGHGEADLTAVARTATNWLNETAQKGVNYGRTSPLFLHAHWTLSAGTSVRHAEATLLWCKWQETLLLSSRLLRPICRAAEGERNWVKQEIARLTAQVRVEPLDSMQRNAASGGAAARGIVLPTEEMHNVLLEAIDIASQWLRLCQAKASASASPLPQDALDLRDEVLQRTDGVLNELNEQERANPSPLVRAGVACCRRTVEQIRSLFEAQRPLLLNEPDPRHVLSAELLKIPGLELDEQWLPEAEPATLERELFEHLNRGDVDWRQAYEQHVRHEDHIATGRLLELDVWSSEVERDELRLQREAHIAGSRALLDRELNEMVLDWEAVAIEGRLSETELVEIEQRLERLHNELPRVLNFGPYRRQLDQIRSSLQRSRSQSLAEGPVSQVNWSAATLEARRQRLARAETANAGRNGQPFTEAAVYLTDIFSGG